MIEYLEETVEFKRMQALQWKDVYLISGTRIYLHDFFNFETHSKYLNLFFKDGEFEHSPGLVFC